MADKAISELVSAEQITAADMFVLEQNGTAKKLTGQVLLNWLTAAADGHGGIQSIVKRSTSGLADTYRITMADTTVFDFVVTNGRGISSLQKTGTSGLVDTYTFTYNDGTKETFTVTNGQKGDKGDNAYIWVKYASRKPTASSNSFGDVPDDWIGVYFGFSSTAPTDWREYNWYKIKGEKGDTGDPAILISSDVKYQVSDSGTIIPSGAWSASVPVVAQGKYLWTRTTNNFNTGSPVVSYSVSRMGMDGSGSVSSVANISPDENGNVPLTASDVGALPNTGGDMTGELRMNGQPISGLNMPTANDQAANMGFVNQQMKKAAPRNLLDNSDFRNPVNQRGITVSNNGFIVDRWYAFDGDVTISENGIFTTGNGYIQQRLLSGTIKPESVYTLAVYYSDGTADVNTNGEYASIPDFDIVNHIKSNGKIIASVALYEGKYTIDTLPEYQSKGYANELLVCNQYDPETGEYIGVTSTPTDAVLKSNVVNNFTTTEEGFVADARALKVLNDSKLSLELLWENDSPTSEFAQKEISVPGLSNYKMIAIETLRGTFYIKNNAEYLYMSSAVSWSAGDSAITSRVAEIRNSSILFMSGYAVNVLDRIVQKSDNEFVPAKIYGIKEV